MSELSIIVPVYNKRKYIERCIQSLQKQSFSDIEVILVDDGSSDGSKEICKKYAEKDKRIRVICQDHKGPIQARYEGIKLADTEYVTFVDADDWIETNTYETLLPYMRSGYDLVKFLMVHDYGQGKLFNYKNKFHTGMYDRKQIEEIIYPCLVWDIAKDDVGASSSLCDKIIKKSVLEKSFVIAQHLKYHYCEDSTVMYPAYRWIGSLIITDHVLYHHCKNINVENGYLKNESFFDDLYMWYKHLKRNMTFIPDAEKQIEGIYMNAMIPRKIEQRLYVDKIRFLFPYEMVDKDSNVVIWGFGNVGKSYMEQIRQSNYCKVLAVVDKNYQTIKDGCVCAPEIIKNIDMDFVVIAIYDRDIICKIKDTLMGWGINRDKIIYRK